MAAGRCLIIDVQVGLVDGLPLHNNKELIEKLRELLERARGAGNDVIFVQHDGSSGDLLEPGTSGWPIHPAIAPLPGEPVVRKTACDSFFETTLDQTLRERGITELVVAGAMTQYCIDTSCRRAVSIGYDVVLASDAHGTADTALLAAPQIISHHNAVLNGLDAGDHKIKLSKANEISF